MKFFFDSIPFKKHIISFMLSFLITSALLGIAAFIFSATPPSQKIVSAISSYSYCLSALISAILCTYGAKNNGLLKGVINAGIYVSILYLCGIIFFKNTPDVQDLIKMLPLTSFFGAVGGIIGINLKK